LAGYEDVNDAERLCHDLTFRLIGSEQIWGRGAALTSRVHSLGTELLTQGENLREPRKGGTSFRGAAGHTLSPKRQLDFFNGRCSGTH